MYGIFCDKKCFRMDFFSENWLEEDFFPENDSLVSAACGKIERWLESESGDMCVNGDECRIFAHAMTKVFRMAPAAGGVVLTDDGFVSIIRNGIPDLPKGHIETGESPETAAVREVEEETGISNLHIIKPLPDTWHCYRLNGQWVLKKTSWFLMNCDDSENFIPQTEEGITEVKIVKKEGFPTFLEKTFTSIAEMMKNFSFRWVL